MNHSRIIGSLPYSCQSSGSEIIYKTADGTNLLANPHGAKPLVSDRRGLPLSARIPLLGLTKPHKSFESINIEESPYPTRIIGDPKILAGFGRDRA